jgi:hypothetical protein
MNKRSIWFYGSLVVLILTIILLVSGSSILTIPLDKNNSIPLGTFITWAGIISFPTAVYTGIKDLRSPLGAFYKYLSYILKGLLILAILWVPICYLLAGNISFSFAEKESFQGGQLAMKWFWRLSYGIGIGSMAIVIIHWVLILVKKKR